MDIVTRKVFTMIISARFFIQTNNTAAQWSFSVVKLQVPLLVFALQCNLFQSIRKMDCYNKASFIYVSKPLKKSWMRLLQFLNEQTFNLTSLECRAIWSLKSKNPVFSDFFEKHCSNLEMLTLDNWESYMESGNYSKQFIKFISSMVS